MAAQFSFANVFVFRRLRSRAAPQRKRQVFSGESLPRGANPQRDGALAEGKKKGESLCTTGNYCGATATLGLAFASTGKLFPFFSPMLGLLGVFLTGSDTSSNALFGNLQVVTAGRLGLDPVLMAAANAAGGDGENDQSANNRCSCCGDGSGRKRASETLSIHVEAQHISGILGDHSKAAIGYQFKTGHRERA